MPQPLVSPRAAPFRPAADIPSVRRRPWGGLVSGIRVGKSLITVVLVVVCAIRALADGTAPVSVVAVSIVFAGWYFGGLLLSERTDDRALAAGWLVGLSVIWLGSVSVSPEFVWLAFPLWLLAGFVLRMRWALILSAVVFAVVVLAPVAHTGETTYAGVIGPLVGGIFALGISRGYLELVRDGEERRRLIASLIEAQQDMAALQDELARTQREAGAFAERTRLSRDIHDTVAQSVSSVRMIALAALESGSPADATRSLEQIRDLSAEGLGDIRRVVNALAPLELDGSALADAIGRMLDRLAADTGITTELRVDDSIPVLPTSVEVALLRTAQSALANVRTHARAGRVVVNLVDAEDAVRLDIVDDGAGFDADDWSARAPRADDHGYGLVAMRARLRELGGGLDVESAPGDGTALSAFVPLGGWGADA